MLLLNCSAWVVSKYFLTTLLTDPDWNFLPGLSWCDFYKTILGFDVVFFFLKPLLAYADEIKTYRKFLLQLLKNFSAWLS